MKLLTEITIKIKRGFLPHLTNEIYKRSCGIRKLGLVSSEKDHDLFTIEIIYYSKEKLKGLVAKIAQHENNFQIISSKNSLEDELLGGLLNVSSRLKIDNKLDYEINIMGAYQLASELVQREKDSIKYTGISKNIGLLSGIAAEIDSYDAEIELHKHYIHEERDSIIINRFTGFNAFPFLIKYNQIEDFIKTLKGIEPSFSAVRLAHLENGDNLSLYEQIYSETSLPIISKYYDEIPICILIAIFHLFKKDKFDFRDKNVGLIGFNASSLRITRILLDLGFVRILGYDDDLKLMHLFDKEGGLGTSQENIFNNSDLIILFKEHYNPDEFYKIGSGQVVISLVDREIDEEKLNKQGVKKIVSGSWMDLSILFPGLLKGLIDTGIKSISDDQLVEISKMIFKIKSKDDILPDIFSDIHERIPEFLHELFQPASD